MNVLVIEPGHGSAWLTHAVYVDRHGKMNARGRSVRGMYWEYNGGSNMPDDYRGEDIPLTYPRKFILKTEETL
jgi:hypothetical protein